MGKDENYHRAGRSMLPCEVTGLFQPFVLMQKAMELQGVHIYSVWNIK